MSSNVAFYEKKKSLFAYWYIFLKWMSKFFNLKVSLKVENVPSKSQKCHFPTCTTLPFFKFKG